MHYDIVSTNKKYKGIERTITITDFLLAKNNNDFEELLDLYYEYIEHMERCIDKEGLEHLITLCSAFKEKGVPCEVIIYDTVPFKGFLGYHIEELGIDIVHDMCESLLADEISADSSHLLNENGLCSTPQDIEQVIYAQDHGNIEWNPCYIYRIIL